MNQSRTNIEQLFRLIGRFANQEFGQTSNFEYIRTVDSIWLNQLINLKTSENETDFVWKSSDRFLTCDSSGKHPNGGYFGIKK